MQLANRPALDRPALAPTVSDSNRSVYRRLKMSLSLNLRRQIFLAVCDDLTVRNWFAAKLHAELAHPKTRTNGQHPSANGITLDYPRLVSLWLNLQHPDPIVQVSHWLSQHPERLQSPTGCGIPGFQIIGVEHLTRQPMSAQQAFLSHLQQSDRAIAGLDSTLLLWLTRPWLHAIQQSAPALWNCHTALFEFEGDPMIGSVAEGNSSLLVPVRPQQRCDRQVETDATQWRSANPEDLAETLPTTIATDWQPIAEVKPLQEIQYSDLANGNGAKGELERSTEIADPESELDRLGSIAGVTLDEEFLVTRPEVAEKLQAIEQLHQQIDLEADPTVLAPTYQELGNLLRDRIEQGDTAEATLTLAIQAYEQTLVWSEESAPWWADVLNDIGNLYWMLSRQSSQAALHLPYLEQAIVAYKLAITKSDPQVQPRVYALIQSNLGSVYGDRAQYCDRAESLQQSALAYEESLRYRTLEDDPVRYAATQNNLGTTYWNLAQHQQPIAHLQQAIAAYQQALRYYSPDCEPLHYAMLQNNLGTAYWNLAQHSGHDKPAAIDWLLQSTVAYQNALVYRTLTASPLAHAATQNNLGTAFWNLATLVESPSDRSTYLNQAIAAYTACLAALETLPTQSPLTFDPAAAHNHLGLSYHQRAIDPHTQLEATQRSTDLEAALHHHLQSFQSWQHDPDLSPTAFQAIVQTVKAFYTQFGLKGQNLALSKVPATLLPELMRRL